MYFLEQKNQNNKEKGTCDIKHLRFFRPIDTCEKTNNIQQHNNFILGSLSLEPQPGEIKRISCAVLKTSEKGQKTKLWFLLQAMKFL